MRLLALGVLAVCAVSATACGGSGGGSAAPVAAAAVKSSHAGGVKVDISVAFSVGGLPSGAVTGTGTFDRNSGEMTIDMSNLMQVLPVPTGSGRGVEEIFRHENGDPVIYMKIPFLAGQLPRGKSWVRVDLQEAGSSMGLDINRLLGQSGSNPTQTLDLLRAAGKTTKVGPDIVGGVAVTQYHTVVDLKKALTLQGEGDSVRNLLASGAAPMFPVDVWIGDKDGLVHQIRLTQTGTANGRSVSTLTTMRLTHWGTTVSVAAPPASEVFDATSLGASKARKA